MTKQLKVFGLQSDKDFEQPLLEMDRTKAIVIVLNWIMMYAREGHKFDLRIPSSNKVYETCLSVHKKSIYVQEIREAPELIGKVWHYWGEQVNYQTLTPEKIQNSTYHADLLESFLEVNDAPNKFIEGKNEIEE